MGILYSRSIGVISSQGKYIYISRTNISYLKLIALILFLIVSLKTFQFGNLEKYDIEQISGDINKYYLKINKKKNIFWNYTFLKNEMHHYELYNTFKTVKLSLILWNNDNIKNNYFQLINQIKLMINKNFDGIEIILYPKTEKEKYSIIK